MPEGEREIFELGGALIYMCACQITLNTRQHVGKQKTTCLHDVHVYINDLQANIRLACNRYTVTYTCIYIYIYIYVHVASYV